MAVINHVLRPLRGYIVMLGCKFGNNCTVFCETYTCDVLVIVCVYELVMLCIKAIR